MGILRANKTLANYLEACDTKRVADLSEKRPVNVCFDGSLFVFTGCVESSLRRSTDPCAPASYDEALIAETAFAVLQSHVQIARSLFRVHKIMFYIDGVKPAMKRHTTEMRRKNVVFSFHKAASLLCARVCHMLPNVEIVNLLLGESEHEFFTHRDTTRPNVLITDDTDLLHIAYRYARQSKHDVVFVCKKNFASVYDMSRLDFGMPKLLFALVMFTKGSDFTDSLITDSMCEAIFRLYSDRQTNRRILRYMAVVNDVCAKYAAAEVEVQRLNCTRFGTLSLNQPHDYSDDEEVLDSVPAVYEIGDVWTVLSSLLLMLLHAQNLGLVSYRWNVAPTDESHTVQCSKDYAERLTWSVNYSLIGARFVDYHTERVPYAKIHSLNFYLDALSTNADFKRVMYRPSLVDLKLFKTICTMSLK